MQAATVCAFDQVNASGAPDSGSSKIPPPDRRSTWTTPPPPPWTRAWCRRCSRSCSGIFGNPASRSHGYGWAAENLAIKGAAAFRPGRGRHLITLKTEHKAVLDTLRELERDGQR